MRLLHRGILFAFMLPGSCLGQGLFENAGNPEGNEKFPVRLNGFARGDLYLGEYTTQTASEVRSGYGEAALKVSAIPGSHGRLFTELRFRNGYEYNEWINEFSVREAYADLYLGNFKFRAGHAIIAWGRADAINPTNNLTPQDFFVRSPEPDDMRLGNFLVRGQYSIIPQIRLEAIWVPKYRYSIYRFDLFEMPGYVKFSENPLPSGAVRNGSLAAKIDFFFDIIDGSLSWFNGFDPMPGIQPGDITGSPAEDLTMEMYARAFRQQTLGLDFSCGLGSFGVRGEAALRIPTAEYRNKIYAPERDLRYVLEVDRSFGIFSMMAMYVGQHVFDFTEMPGIAEIPDIDPQLLQDPVIWTMIGPMMDKQVEAFNRVIFEQTRENSHTLAISPSVAIFHSICELEVFGLYNFSTEEWGLIPGLSWDVMDNLELKAGGQYFEGPDNTRYKLISPVFNGAYFQLKYSF